MPAAPQAPNFGNIKAPDPNTDPEGYARYVELKAQTLIDYEKAKYLHEQTAAQRRATQMQQLWDDFADQHKEYAANTERVEIATQRVLQRQAAAGVNVDDYMFNNREAFMADVIKESDKLFGKPVATDEEDDDEGDDDATDNRTAVVAPGTGKGKGAPAEPQSPFGALSQEINAWQQKTGFYR